MVMRALSRKLVRDVWHTRSQGLAISLVIAAGVAMFVGYFSTFDSLRLAQQTYYDRFRFADVFVTRQARAAIRWPGTSPRYQGWPRSLHESSWTSRSTFQICSSRQPDDSSRFPRASRPS